MRWLSLGAVLSCVGLGLVGAGCGKTVYRSYESHYCSSTEDDEPYYECSKSSDLVCINTYEKSYPQTDNRPDKVVSMWLCREACDPTAPKPCVGSDEVCCPGKIYGRNYGREHACVLREYCDAFAGMNTKDAGAKPDAAKPDAGAGAEAGEAIDGQGVESDAGADAPVD